MKQISIDLETFSDVDLKSCGVYKYAESPAFKILLFAYSVDGGEVQVVDIASGEEVPADIIAALSDPSVIKWAFNAQFERVCLSAAYGGGEYFYPQSWRCSKIWAAYMGLPLTLEDVGAVLGLEKQKMKEGKDLIKFFCVPCKATKVNGGRTRNLPEHDSFKWNVFKTYNKRDVETEMLIQAKLSKFPVPDFVWEEYAIDQRINDRGIGVDMELVKAALVTDRQSSNLLSEKMKALTGLENPKSVVQMKAWLAENGLEVKSLGKKEVAAIMKTAPSELAGVLALRSQLAKSSIKKYQAMENAVCNDSRAHGMFQFYGANRSGRWAGRIIQLQNLPQNHIEDLKEARELVKSGDYEALTMLYDDIPDTLSQLIRTAFVPQNGMKFIVSDFSAIEARVLSHLAGEKWRAKVFAEGGDIYCASASQMFKVPVVKHGMNGHLRQKGKIAELALGYGGSVGALKSMGALDMGLSEDELPELVAMWRNANPNIVKYWWAIGAAVKKAVKEHLSAAVGNILFTYKSGMLFISLPSGRKLCYVKPKMGISEFGTESVIYMGIGENKKWTEIESYGPKFVENIVQAVSRDILMYAMRTLSDARICGHVHDELIIECPQDTVLGDVCEKMGCTPPWISGLILRADGYECEFYMKD